MTEVLPLESGLLESVLRLDAVCFNDDPFALNWWHKALAQTGASGWVLCEHGVPTGYCLFSEVLDEAELLRIAVDPQHRAKGWGSVLLQQAQQVLEKRGVTQFFLEVRASNLAAHALYHRCGWQPCGRRKQYYPLGDAREDALLFSRHS